MYLDKLVDVPVGHPFRDHRENLFVHLYPQQREHIGMAEAFPCYNFLAEPLHDHNQLFNTHLINLRW